MFAVKAPRERGKLLHHFQDMIAKHMKRDATLLKILRDSERGESFTADYLLLLQHVILAGHKGKSCIRNCSETMYRCRY